jgi:fatty-acyl-CoA synthase
MDRLTVGDYFDRVALATGEREALVFPQQAVRWRYRDVRAHVSQLAKGLMGIGVDSGDHVAVFATNRSEWVLLQLAVAKIGAVLVPIDPAAGADDLGQILTHSDASTLFLVHRADDVSLCDVLLECCPEARGGRPGHLASRRFPLLKRIALLGEGTAPGGALAWSDVLTAGVGITDHLLRRRQEAAEPSDLAMLQYSARTTGLPTGVELTHLNLVNDAIAAGDCMRLTRRDRVCAPVSFAAPFGSVVGVLTTLGRGAVLVVPSEHFDVGETLAAVASERCTALHAEPRMLGSALRHPQVIRTDLSSLRTGIMMGSSSSQALVREAIARLHLPDLTVGHGRAETTAVITQTRTDDPIDLRARTVGRALPDVEVRIVDPMTGVDVPSGTEGELCCRGFPVMRGYYKMAEASAATVGANGWLRTGDLAVMDRFGYCTITGRRAEPTELRSS